MILYNRVGFLGVNIFFVTWAVTFTDFRKRFHDPEYTTRFRLHVCLPSNVIYTDFKYVFLQQMSSECWLYIVPLIP